MVVQHERQLTLPLGGQPSPIAYAQPFETPSERLPHYGAAALCGLQPVGLRPTTQGAKQTVY